MLFHAKHTAWAQDLQNDLWQLQVPIGSNVNRIAFTAYRWQGQHLKIEFSNVEDSSTLIRDLGGLCFGVSHPPVGYEGNVNVVTDCVPSSFICRGITPSEVLSATRSIMPRSLNGLRKEPSTVRPIDTQLMKMSLENNDLDSVIAELAFGILSENPITQELQHFLTFVSQRPMLRSEAMGALIAAICGTDGRKLC